jgi:C1A family cysteine protease
MNRPITKPSVLPPPAVAATRRNFISGTAALTAGAATGGLLASPSSAASYDPSFDLRTGGYVTPVQDQGVTCNSCTAYAVVAAVECTYNKKNGFSGATGPNLDEMDLFTNPGPPMGCVTTHWWPRFALAYCMTNGLKWEGSSNPRVYAAATYLLTDKLNDTKDRMKEWIYNKGPVIAVMVQYDNFYQFGKDWFTSNGSVPNTTAYSPGKHKDPGKVVGGHTIAIIGYDQNKHWICKNSWGQTWNGDGFVYIEQGQGNRAETYIEFIDVWGVSVLP